MIQIEKKFFNQGLNTDDADFVVGEGELINAINIRFGTTEAGKIGYVESVPGTSLIHSIVPAGTNTIIGTAIDEANRRLIYFNHNSNGNHGIYSYDIATGTASAVLLNAQVTGGLGFNSGKRINGANVIGQMLYWNDSFNEPKRFNYFVGIKMNTPGAPIISPIYTVISPLAYEDVTLIRKPPIFPPTFAKSTDGGFADNLIENESFQFAIQYLYYDDEFSALSPWSKSSKLNTITETYNRMLVTVPTSNVIPQTVQTVRLIVRVNGQAFVFKSWDRTDVNVDTLFLAHNTGTALSVYYYNNSYEEPIDNITATKPFDNVPLRSESMEHARNRTFLGNNLMGYKTPLTTSMSVSLPAPVSYDSTGTAQVFKSGTYKAGVVFYDRFLRKCGVVTNDSLLINLPPQVFYNYSGWNDAYPSIQWSFSGGAEIPVWAYYYSPVLTENLKTRFFITGFTNDFTYLKKDTAGAYVYGNHTFTGETVAIAFDAGSLTAAGMGYTFSEGDQCKLYKEDGQIFEISVIGQDGNYILLAPVNIDALFTGVQEAYYEIYTPYIPSSQEGFYERGQIYPVRLPGQLGRDYGPTPSGTFSPDSFLVPRKYKTSIFLGEAMAPRDKYYKRWDTDAGRINQVIKQGQVQRKNGIVFSNVYIDGTGVNGLCSFEPLNESEVPLEAGEIKKLKLASKVSGDGNIMLAICRNEVASIYLGESQIIDNSGNSFIAISNGVIGSINVLKGSFGTSHQESVQELDGNVFWFSVHRGAVVQYSANGVFPISNYKMTRFLSRYSAKYLSENQTAPVIGGIDPYNKEYFLKIPSVTVTVPAFGGGIVKANEFDIYDGTAKTLSFKLTIDKFVCSYTFLPDCFEYLGNLLFAFKNGALYRHNDTAATDTNFYGVQDTARLMFVANANPNKVKTYATMSVEGNMSPSYVLCYSENPNVQVTDLVSADFVNEEGVFKAPIYFDRLSPNVTGTPEQKLYTGDEMRSPALKIMTEFTTTSKKLQLKFINIGYSISAGHNT